jgi:hypothetical protein
VVEAICHFFSESWAFKKRQFGLRVGHMREFLKSNSVESQGMLKLGIISKTMKHLDS